MCMDTQSDRTDWEHGTFVRGVFNGRRSQAPIPGPLRVLLPSSRWRWPNHSLYELAEPAGLPCPVPMWIQAALLLQSPERIVLLQCPLQANRSMISTTEACTCKSVLLQCMKPQVEVKREKEPKKPVIKKPLNAFMLYMKEMRAKVIAECTLKESAAINQILGRRWHALTREEQAKYYELARKERQLHMQLYPTWSARDNYVSTPCYFYLHRPPTLVHWH
ncbi:hypothetical protein GOODEAATRI_009510 [Goodea atripinnis]|uniref:HMG box domain-containing protein n=1 Tax=Goodea atripinnis TaxID=208336 RepID=A0ABV0NT73_9TELE